MSGGTCADIGISSTVGLDLLQAATARFLDCGKVVKALSVASVSLRDGNNVKPRDVEARNTHQPVTFRARVFPVSLNLSVEMRDGIALACRVNPLSALRRRFATRRIPAEIRNFTTLWNSGDTAALVPGSRHAPVWTKPGVHFNRWQGRTPVGLGTKLLAQAGRDVTSASSRPGAEQLHRDGLCVINRHDRAGCSSTLGKKQKGQRVQNDPPNCPATDVFLVPNLNFLAKINAV